MKYEPQDVPAAEIENALSAPTIFVNRFFANVTPLGARISFGEGESAGSPTHFRGTVQMGLFEAFELQQILNALLAPYKEKLEADLAERQALMKARATSDDSKAI